MAAPVAWPKCSASQFAELLGVVPASVSQWLDAGMPASRTARQGSRVEIDVTKALPWVLSRREPPGSQRERLAKEQADKVALENGVKRRELIHVAQVSDVLSTLAADLAARHDALSGRVANELAGISEPAVIRERLLDEARGVRAAVADAVAKLAESLGAATDDGGDPDAAEEADGGGVGERVPRPAARKRRARAVAKR